MKNNLNFLPKEIIKKINETNINKNVEILPAKSNSVTVKVNNTYVYSKYNPVKETERAIKKYNINENSVIFLIGFGLGYNLIEITNNYKYKKIFIIEHNYNILNVAFNYNDILDYLKQYNVFFLNTEDENQFIDTISDNLNIAELKNTIIIQNDILTSFKPNKFKYSISLINKILNFKKVNFNTISMFKKEWLENTFENLLYLENLYEFSELKEKLKNMPLLIVGAGPSVDENIEEIKKLKNKVIIACVDTAAKILLEADIVPDIIAVADSQQVNYNLIKDLDLKDSIILTNLIIYPELFKKFIHNKKLIYNSGTPILEKIKEKYNINLPDLKSGGSVSTILLSFGIYCNCNPIIFTGQDLSYPNLQFYGKGTAKDSGILNSLSKFNTFETYYLSTININNYIFEKDINGNKVLTTNIMKGFRDWILYEIKNNNHIDFVNVSGKGILNSLIKQDNILNITQKYSKNLINYKNLITKNCKLYRITKDEVILYYKYILKEFYLLKNKTKSILEYINSIKNINIDAETTINSYINYYNSNFLKIFVDFNIENYVLLNENCIVRDFSFYKGLIKEIYNETNYYIKVITSKL